MTSLGRHITDQAMVESIYGTSPRKLRIGYLSGPSEAERYYTELRTEFSDYFGTNYMKQFLQLVEDLNAEAYVITWHGGGEYCRKAGRFTFDNRKLREPSGLLYYVNMLIWHFRILARMIVVRPDVMLLTAHNDFWWTLAPLRLLGIKFIASYHGALWSNFLPRPLRSKVFQGLNATLILRGMKAIVSTSHDISEQVRTLIGPTDKLIEHLPSYSRRQFDGITSALDLPSSPFEVIYMGRIEVSKGVFDLLEVAAQLEADYPGCYRFHFCGDGSQAEKLVNQIVDRGLSGAAIYHGYCDPERIREVMSSVHLSVVPSRSDLTAGFEMTCCEATLSGRPLVASAACPALHYLRGASIEVRPDDVVGLREAIERLYRDRAEYERLEAACKPLMEQFYDPERSWTAAMHSAIDRL